MRRLIATLGILVALAGITTGVVLALNYEGEDFCQDTPAWPNGTYLGQMHPFHSDFYRGYAERRDWDPCTTWALDQRNSAIRGLRELGYTVIAPEGGAPPPGPAGEDGGPYAGVCDGSVSMCVTGRGNSVERVDLAAGLYVFGAAHTGGRNFFVTLVGQRRISLFILGSNDPRPAETTQRLGGGIYLLEVESPGDWIVFGNRVAS